MKTTLAILASFVVVAPCWAAQTPDAVTPAVQKIDADLADSQRLLTAQGQPIATCFPPGSGVAGMNEFAEATGKARAGFEAAAKAYADERVAMQGFSDSFFNTMNAVTICGASAETAERASKLNQNMVATAQSLSANCDAQTGLAKKFHEGYAARTTLIAKSGCGDAQTAVKTVDRHLTEAAKTCAALNQEVASTSSTVATLNRRLQAGCEAAKKESEIKLLLLN